MIWAEWAGLGWIVATIFVSFLAVGTGIIIAELVGRRYAVLWIVGIQGAFQVMIAFTSAQFVGLVIGGVTFITIAGSLIYPTLELGQNYLSEFYGEKVSRTSVHAQLVVRVITALLLAFLFLLPFPPGFEDNNKAFLDLNKIIPRIAVASIIATYITGLVMVYVYELVRRLTDGRWMWVRALTANITSMAVNSVLFVVIAFAGVMSTSVILNMVMIQVLFKFIDSFFELGFLYGLKGLKERGVLHIGDKEGIPEEVPAR